MYVPAFVVSGGTLPAEVDFLPLTASENKLTSILDSISSDLMGYYIAAGFSSISTVQAVALVKEREVRESVVCADIVAFPRNPCLVSRPVRSSSR